MTAEDLVGGFRSLTVLVVGDICLDRWCRYDPSLGEPSRETGIERTAVVETEVTPGGGGTVANNLIALGAGRVEVLGVCGDDGHGYELRQALELRGIGSSRLLRSPVLPTFTYTKLLNCRTGQEDRSRVDYVNSQPLPREVESAVVEALEAAVPESGVVLVSDQAETREGGVVTPRVREALRSLAVRHRDKVFWVDSRERAETFRQMLVKPNESEAEAASKRLFGSVNYAALRAHLEAPALIVTRGAGGAVVVTADGCMDVPAQANPAPVDICGAGDSFSAAASMALAVTGSPCEAARVGNAAASITITKPGTGTASARELLAILAGSR
jgi:rfaE bifunctional protein kinase chain/domain